MTLTARERRELRNKVAREAIKQGLVNPLISKDEAEKENLAFMQIVVKRHSDRDGWGYHSRMLTRRTALADMLKKGGK